MAPHYTILKNTWLTFFAVYVKDDTNSTNNSIRFSNYIRNVSTEVDKIIVSFDFTTLYKNIPTIWYVKRNQRLCYNDDEFTSRTAMTQDEFLEPVNLVLATT